jgi:hypothetical protein
MNMNPKLGQRNLSCKMIASLVRFREIRRGADMRANSGKNRPHWPEGEGARSDGLRLDSKRIGGQRVSRDRHDSKVKCGYGEPGYLAEMNSNFWTDESLRWRSEVEYVVLKRGTDVLDEAGYTATRRQRPGGHNRES